MIGYRCKCGDATAFGSMPPYQCAWCEKCQSSLASHPDGHRDRVDHEFSHVEKIATDQGEVTITRCRYCHRTRAEIATEEQP